MTKFSISAEDYNEILRLGKIFAGKTDSREVLKNVHFKSFCGPDCPELTVEASDGYIYGMYRVQFISYEDDLCDFLFPPASIRADKGTVVEFTVGDGELTVILIADGYKMGKSAPLDEYSRYPDFSRALPSSPDDGELKTFNAGKIATCLKWFKASENVASWRASPDCVYFANRKRAAACVGVKMRERLNEVLLDFTHRRA